MKIQRVNKKYHFLLLVMFGTFITVVKAHNIPPFHYWTFNGKETGKDIISNWELNTLSYQCGYTIVDGKSGNAVDMNNTNCLVVTSAIRSNVTDEFSIEFFFKGTTFTFLTFSQQSLIIRFSYASFLFRTTTTSLQGKPVTDNFEISLKGTGRQSYNYYTDDNWHHLVFTSSLKTGKKEIWVDGECPEGFSKSIPKGKHFEFGGSDGFRNTDQIDELAFYNTAIPPQLIRQHYAEVNNGKSYSFVVNKNVSIVSRKSIREVPEMDPKEFAPGYPDYTIQATDQLKSFPLPRYNAVVPVKRNMSWMDIIYLHRELPGKGGKGFGKTTPWKAVELTEEMVKYWNYYIDIPVLRTTAAAAQKNYQDKSTLPGALVDYANRNPQYPVASILIEAQGRPTHAGFESSKAYVVAQDLPATYYLRDKKSTPVVRDKKRWFSPLMPLDIMQKDGLTSLFYLNQLLKYLNHPPALINENGEVFGHIRKEALLKLDPAVWAHYQRSRLTESQYSGWFQYRMDSVYRAAIMNRLDTFNTHFSFYNISAFNPDYWPDYAMRRELNRWDKQTVYPTPDFYPHWPDNWQNARGAFNGYGAIAAGRVTETALGDRFFSPFVSAGWGEEENNIRPAQWLALLKAMVMLGADFFYTGYFNVTGAGGKWPNGAGPNDPRGYAYQIAMPAYAQAIRTWAPEFFEKGELLNPVDPKDQSRQFRFKAQAENELILVRKLGQRYLIYGSIQPNSNIKGNVPLAKQTSIDLEGKTISFEIRKQGSMYVLDLSSTQPVFFQLDGWHQYEHPYYWDKAYCIEAEAALLLAKSQKIRICTNYNKKEANNFSDYTSYIILPGGGQFSIPAYLCTKKSYTFSMRIRVPANSGATVEIRSGNAEKKMNVSGSDWKITDTGLTLSANDSGAPIGISIMALEGTVEIDWIKLTPGNE